MQGHKFSVNFGWITYSHDADCRICVWNAADGSIVHSLTGHTDSVSGLHFQAWIILMVFLLLATTFYLCNCMWG